MGNHHHRSLGLKRFLKLVELQASSVWSCGCGQRNSHRQPDLILCPPFHPGKSLPSTKLNRKPEVKGKAGMVHRLQPSRHTAGGRRSENGLGTAVYSPLALPVSLCATHLLPKILWRLAVPKLWVYHLGPYPLPI